MIDHYLYKLKEKPYKYPKIVFPHDQNRQSIVGTSSLCEAHNIVCKLQLRAITVGRQIRIAELVHIATTTTTTTTTNNITTTVTTGYYEVSHSIVFLMTDFAKLGERVQSYSMNRSSDNNNTFVCCDSFHKPTDC